MSEDNLFVADVDQELYCWRDSSRHCSNECVSYDDRCEADSVWSPCILLNIQRAQTKSHANIALEMKRYNDRNQSGDDDLRKAMKWVAERQQEPGRKFASKEEADAYAEKVREMDCPPPEIKI